MVDGSVESILADSKRRLTRLKLLSNFFENIDLLSIYIKTQIIHQLFEENKTLDYSKLELFHLQYTDSLLELLLKIKKKKEHDMISVINEININQQDHLLLLTLLRSQRRHPRRRRRGTGGRSRRRR